MSQELKPCKHCNGLCYTIEKGFEFRGLDECPVCDGTGRTK